jgi:peroxisomal coenzyme A diphosphatase NUDT7
VDSVNKLVMEGLREKWPVTPGINGKEERFNSAVLVLLILVDEEYHFVFQKRAANIRQPGEICFPGGKFDPKIDVGFRETAIRETSEELGVAREKISVIGTLDTIIAPMGTTVDAFLGIIDVGSLDNLRISSEEVEKVFTVPVSYFEDIEPEAYEIYFTAHPSYTNQTGAEVISFPAKELGLSERYWKPWGNAPYNVFVYRVAGEIIWGITARLIRDVIAKIKNLAVP